MVDLFETVATLALIFAVFFMPVCTIYVYRVLRVMQGLADALELEGDVLAGLNKRVRNLESKQAQHKQGEPNDS